MSDITQITPQLFVASEMSERDLPRIEELGCALVISMIGQREPEPRLGAPGRELVWLRAYDNFFTPIPLRKLFEGVAKALPLMEQGQKVLVFCREGKRRSVTMAAAILIAAGYSAQAAMDLLKSKRQVANPMYFYVRHRIRKFERHWRRRSQEVS